MNIRKRDSKTLLSPEIGFRLNQARLTQSAYTPNSSIQKTLKQKNLVICVGSVAIGKSFIMNEITRLDPDFARTPVFTTREARSDDESGMFRNLPHDDTHVSDLLDRIDTGTVVQYAVHPTTGKIYGSLATDYPADFNLLATLTTVVEQLRQIPFKNTYVIGFATEPNVWIDRLKIRYPIANEERHIRLHEAISSLEWLLDEKQQNFVKWIENTDGSPDKTARAVIDIVKYNKEDNKQATSHAQEMLELVREMV